MTSWGAHAEFQESKKGKIIPGYVADLTILSDDITKIEPNRILNTEILGTIIAGKFVYQK